MYNGDIIHELFGFLSFLFKRKAKSKMFDFVLVRGPIQTAELVNRSYYFFKSKN